MLLRCVQANLSDADRARLGPGTDFGFHLEVGELYAALGLEFVNGLAWVDLSENDRTVIAVPMILFEIVDGRIPDCWEARNGPDASLSLWPRLFYERAFHDRLSNGDPVLEAEFGRLRRELEAEAR